MKKNHKRWSNHFTLVELLVAMGVFSILMLLMVQFFTASQRIWVNMEQKNNLYADARVAMDLITTLVQGTYFAKGQVPYEIVVINTDPDRKDAKTKKSSGGGSSPVYIDEYNSKIYFPTQSQIDLIEDAGKVIFVSIQRATSSKDTAGQLRMAVLTDKDDKDFNLYFPPYGEEGSGYINVKAALDELKNKFNNIIKKEKTAEEGETFSSAVCVTLLNNVTAFRLIPWLKDTSSSSSDFKFPANDDERKKIPFMIEIQLSIMSEKDYKFWAKEIKWTSEDIESEQAKEFRLMHEHTFTRTVYIGDRPNNDTVF